MTALIVPTLVTIQGFEVVVEQHIGGPDTLPDGVCHCRAGLFG